MGLKRIKGELLIAHTPPQFPQSPFRIDRINIHENCTINNIIGSDDGDDDDDDEDDGGDDDDDDAKLSMEEVTTTIKNKAMLSPQQWQHQPPSVTSSNHQPMSTTSSTLMMINTPTVFPFTSHTTTTIVRTSTNTTSINNLNLNQNNIVTTSDGLIASNQRPHVASSASSLHKSLSSSAMRKASHLGSCRTKEKVC